MSKKLGVKPSTFSGYETGYSKPDVDKLILLSEILEVSIDYLVGIDNDSTLREPQLDYSVNKKGQGVPYYNVDFIGGFDLVFNDDTLKPTFYINFAPFNDSDCWINITGKSMSPIIGHGDLVALKIMNSKSWIDFILFGEIYAIVTDEFRTIKIISKATDNEHLLLIPYNKSEEFTPQEIPIKIIKQIFKVKGSIKKFH